MLHKKGDELIIVKCCHKHNYKIGTHVRVVKVYGGFYKVEDKNYDTWLVMEEEVESYKPPPANNS